MPDNNKTRTQLIEETAALRRRVAELEALTTEGQPDAAVDEPQSTATQAPSIWGRSKYDRHTSDEYRRTETALRESEERFRRVVSSISDHVYMTELTEEGHQINGYISPNVEELTGYPVERFMNDWDFWRSLIHPDDKPAANAQVRRFAGGEKSETEYRMIRADGDVIWVRDSVQVERVVEQQKLTIYGVVSNITDRKLAETLLKDYNRVLQKNVAERTKELAEQNIQLEQEIAERKQVEQALSESEARLRELFEQARTSLILTEDQARRLSLLNEMSQQINLAVSENMVFKVAAAYAPKILRADQISVALLAKTADFLEVLTMEEETGATPTGTALPVKETMVGKAVQEKQVVLASESQVDELHDLPMLVEQGLSSFISAPLVTGGQILGTLNAGYSKPNAYGQRDKHLIQQIASLLASNIESRRLFLKTHVALTETEAYADRLNLLNDMNQQMNLATNEIEIFKIAARCTAEIIEANQVRIILLADRKDEFKVFTFQGQKNRVLMDEELSLAETLVGKVVREKHIINVSDLENDDFLDTRDLLREGLHSFLVAPMMVGERAIGAVSLSSQNHNAYGTRDEGLLMQVVSFLGVTVEKTRRNKELQQATEAAEEAKRVAEAANRAKSEFLANMSHELRTPLNGILGYTQILGKDKSLVKEQKDGIDVIHRSGEHLLTLINDILDLSKIEARKMELNLTEFHLPQMLENIAKVFRVRAEQKGISFAYEALSDLPAGVRADEKKIRQVLANLLSNALKFTKQGGVILKVGVVEFGEFGIILPQSTPQTHPIRRIRFQVEDTGLGIAQDALEEIFQPFQQVGRSSHSTEGTGLGLPISRKLTKMMAGELKVKSVVGEGTVFWFELDLPEVKNLVEIAQSEERTVIGFVGEAYKVLIVDDRWENRAVLVNMLAPLGFEVLEAGDGLEAVDRTIEFQPDVILLDLRMPVMDGFEVMRRIRALPAGRDVVIITVTASAFDHDRQHSLDAGSDDFIAKPFKSETLLDRLQTHLDLEWIYDESDVDRQRASSATNDRMAGDGQIIAPPQSELVALFDLIMRGDIDGLVTQADKLEEMDNQFSPFAVQLRQLAKGFKLKELRGFVKQYLE